MNQATRILLLTSHPRRVAVSRVAVAVIVIVLIVVAASAAIYVGRSTTSATSTTSTSSSGASSSQSSTPQTLTIDDTQWPAPDLSQLWATAEAPYPGWLDYTVYQPLVTTNFTAQYTTGTIQYVPDLAANWTVSSDGMTYTFNLRHGVTFSNGDPFNAYVAWSWFYGGGYYLSGNASDWLSSYSLFNMSNVNFGPSTLALMSSSGLTNPSSQLMSIMSNSSWPIYVTSPYQIVFHIDVPFQFFLATMLGYMGMIPDVQFILNHGGYGNATSFNSYFATNPPPGTGPYEVTQVSVNSFISFTQNPTYWGKNLTQSEIQGNPYINPGQAKNVVINDVSDDLARYTALSTGSAQIAVIQQADWNQVVANPNTYGYVTEPKYSGLIFAFNIVTVNYPTNITAVRQAIVRAINYSDIYSSVFSGNISPWVGPEYPFWSQFYNLGNVGPYPYNVTLAKQILANASINPSTLPPIVFNVAAGCSYCVTAAQIVKADLAQIGLTVNVNQLTFSTLVSYSGSYSFNLQNKAQYGNMGILGFQDFAPGTLSPADYWLSFVSNESLVGNQAIYYNPVVQACDNSFVSTAPLSQVEALCTAAQKQIYDDAPYAWVGTLGLWDGAGSIVYNKDVIKSVGYDPLWDGLSTVPLFNMVQFNSAPSTG
jgi:peptide/nickel transport system substrate-binding protein